MKMFLEYKYGKTACEYMKRGEEDMVVLMHGYGSTKESSTNIEINRALDEKESGISTISFDMYGHGESSGSFKILSISKVMEQISSVMDFCFKERFKNIRLVGSSFTGQIAILGAFRYGVDVLGKAPVISFYDLMKKELGKGLEMAEKTGEFSLLGNIMSYELIEDAKTYDMEKIIKSIDSRVKVIHGTSDEIVPISHIERYAGLFRNLDIVRIDGADHRFEGHFKQMVSEIVEWIEG